MSVKVLKRRPSLKDYEIFKDGTTEAEYMKQVLDRKIDWKQLAESKLITANDAGLLLDYDKQPEDDQANLLGERGPEYATVFIKILNDISTPETAQYVLALVDKLLAANPQRALDFHRAKNEGVNIYAPLLKFLNRPSENPFTLAKAAKITATLMSNGEVASSPAVSEFLHYLTSKLGSAKAGELVSILSALKTMLRSQVVQTVFVREGGLKSLTTLLRKETQNTQMLYQVVFCFWLMSFNADVQKDLHDSDAIVRVAEVLKNVLREKVVRVAFAMLRNLLNKPGFNELMIASGLMKLLPALTSRKWQDDDLTEDVRIVGDTLDSFVVTLSSYEKYSAEVLSGNLEWSPVHNEKFWRENISKFEDDNFNLIRCLVALLETDDELVLEVACYDLGEFARFHPDGKKILTQLGGKTKLMTRMSHKSPRVVKQALLAVQKIMVHNWESLNGGTQGIAPPAS